MGPARTPFLRRRGGHGRRLTCDALTIYACGRGLLLGNKCPGMNEATALVAVTMYCLDRRQVAGPTLTVASSMRSNRPSEPRAAKT